MYGIVHVHIRCTDECRFCNNKYCGCEPPPLLFYISLISHILTVYSFACISSFWCYVKPLCYLSQATIILEIYMYMYQWLWRCWSVCVSLQTWDSQPCCCLVDCSVIVVLEISVSLKAVILEGGKHWKQWQCQENLALIRSPKCMYMCDRI